MKKIILFIILLGFLNLDNIAQIIPSQSKLSGMWTFIPPNQGYDTIFSLFKDNKSIKITYRVNSKTVSIHQNPYSYFGFWDDMNENKEPKNINDLKPYGENIRFYDNLGKSYDSLGNLLQQTRSCWMSYNENEDPDHEPAILRFYFGRGTDPDIYQRVKELPVYIIQSLKDNKNEWHKFLLFKGMKSIHSIKASIYSTPNKATKMYLVKGDEVEILAEKGQWLKIRYYGAKTIEGWIKKSDIN